MLLNRAKFSIFLLLFFFASSSYSSLARPSHTIEITKNRKIEKTQLINEVDNWIQDLKSSKDFNRDQVKFALLLKNRFERELSPIFNLKQIEEIFSSIIATEYKKSDESIFKQASVIVSQLNPDEDPIKITKDYFKFCDKGFKSSIEFADSRNYTNKTTSLKVNPATLDEAASAVESKIFKEHTSKSEKQAPSEEETSTEDDTDLI